jgi:uncharacterized protein with HEPN domain
LKDDEVYLLHIRKSIRKIRKYTTSIDRDAFLKNDLVQDAVIRQLEIIGEASKRVSERSREKYPGIPWKDISGMRDKLIHHYFGVDLDAVWLTVENDLQVLEKALK